MSLRKSDAFPGQNATQPGGRRGHRCVTALGKCHMPTGGTSSSSFLFPGSRHKRWRRRRDALGLCFLHRSRYPRVPRTRPVLLGSRNCLISTEQGRQMPEVQSRKEGEEITIEVMCCRGPSAFRGISASQPLHPGKNHPLLPTAAFSCWENWGSAQFCSPPAPRAFLTNNISLFPSITSHVFHSYLQHQ